MIFGLAAQQTLGNLIAGTVLLSARPFRVGERVRLQGGPLAGQIEGTVSSLGLLYTTFATGDDSIMVPNSVVLNVAVLPLREPEAVNLRARLRAGMTPGDLQEILEKSLQTPLRDAPRITLEELDGEEVVVRIAATPRVAAQGRQLASELLGIVSRETRSRAEHAVAQEQVRAAGEHAQQLQAGRRLELGAGEDPQRLAARRLAAREQRRERQEQLVQQPRCEQLQRQVRPALAQQAAHVEARAQLAERGREVEAAVRRGAHVVDGARASRAGWRRRRSGPPRAHRARAAAGSRRPAPAARRRCTRAAPRRGRAARRNARRAASGMMPPVALRAHRAGAHEHRVDGAAQGVEQLPVGASAERARAPVERSRGRRRC